MTGKIFISYRQGDDAGITGRLFDRLLQTFPREQVFRDVDSVEPGIDFVRLLEDQVAECDVLLSVIGKDWIGLRDTTGARRLDNPNDFVRIEIQSALDQGKRVIPVLVRDAHMPRDDELPEAIRPLARRNAVRLTHERFRSDADGLIKAIQLALEKAEGLRKTSLSIAERIEQIAKQQGPFFLAVEAIAIAFLLWLLSYFCGLSWLEHDDVNKHVKKAVGFVLAPNWTIVYMVLFPLYLSVFSVLTVRCRTALIDFSEEHILTDSRGSPISNVTILEAWKKALKDLSPFMILMLFIVAVATIGQWYKVCYVTLITHTIGDAAIDWATLAIVEPKKADWWPTMFFDVVAYAYMGVALFIYLAILMYAAAFAAFLNHLSDNSGQFLLVFRNQIFPQRLSEIITKIYMCVVFGVGAAFAMHMQAEYIQSRYELITDMWFQRFHFSISIVKRRSNGDRTSSTI